MTILDDIRQQYPQYADVPDGKLASAIRQKYYANVDPTEFYKKSGLYHLIDANASPNGDAPANGLGSDSQNFGAGVGKAVKDTGRGIAQASMAVPAFFERHAPEPIAGLSDIVPEWAQHPVDSLYEKLKADQADANQTDAALMHTKAGLGGDIAGNVALSLLGGGLLKGAGITSQVVPAGYKGAAASGSALGLLQPIETGQGEGSRLVNGLIGGGAGVVGQGLANGVGAAIRGGKSLLAPFFGSGQDQIVANTLSRFGGDAVSKATPSAVPGVTADLAEQTGDAGIAQLRRAVADADPAVARQFAEQRLQNNQARVGLLETAAGSPADVASAKAARAQTANQLYSQAVTDAPVQPSADLLKLAERPSMQKAVEMAKGLAAENDQDIGDALSSTQGLHYVKLALDNIANSAGKPGFENVSKASVRKTQDDLIGEIGKISPDYIAAKDAYKAASGPINQKEILQGLLAKATTNTKDAFGNEVAQPTIFNNSVAQLDQIAKKVTGQKNAQAAQILSPQQQGLLGSIGNDLSRQAVADSVGKSAGSNTVQNLASQNLLGEVSHGLGLPWLADSGLLGTVLKPLDTLYKLFGTNDAIRGKLAGVIANPQSAEAQAIIAKMTAKQRSALADVVSSGSGLVGQSAGLGVGQQPALQR